MDLMNDIIFIGGERLSYDLKNYDKGIGRELKNGKFIYYYIQTGEPVTKKDLERINKLGIPPAWTSVWVSIDPNSMIQAIGTDSKDRKQYRYHHLHIEQAEKEKFLR